MKYEIEDIVRIIGETDEEKRLKIFLNKINKTFGDDYAALILSCDFDIKRSIEKFTRKLNKINNTNAEFILLRAAILSNKENYYTEYVKKMVIEDNFRNLTNLIENDLQFRKNLTRIFVYQSNTKNINLLKNKRNKIETLECVSKLKDYERYITVQDYITKHEYPKIRKKKRNHQ